MTGNELRKKVCDIMNGWVGGVWQGANHREIISIWNSGKDAGQYTMTMSDPYCAATVSAAFIKAGIAAYTGKEVSCPRFITVAKNKGIWVENDAYKPQIGDAILYDWSDSGSGDNTTAPDHIGLVTRVSGNTFVVTEGNMSGGKIGTRNMVVNGRYIRGFICPDYDAIAAKLGGVVAASTASTATAAPKTEVRYSPWKTVVNRSAVTPVYRNTNRTEKIGSLNPGETCESAGRYGDSVSVFYANDDVADDWYVGYVDAGKVTVR